MVRTFIQITALILTLISAYFLLRSSLWLSARDIAELSTTVVGYNPNVVRNLSQQQADAKVGCIIMFLSFIIQMINLSWPMRIDDFAVNKKGIILAIFVCIIISIIFLRISKSISIKIQKDVTNILENLG